MCLPLLILITQVDWCAILKCVSASVQHFPDTLRQAVATRCRLQDHSMQGRSHLQGARNLLPCSRTLLHLRVLKSVCKASGIRNCFLFSSVSSTPNHLPYVFESLLNLQPHQTLSLLLHAQALPVGIPSGNGVRGALPLWSMTDYPVRTLCQLPASSHYP